MGRYLITAFLACLIISYTSVSTAETQKPPDVPRLFGTFAPRPGAWSEYAIFDMTTGGKTVMRLSIVGVTGESYWYEVVNREGESRNIVKMLLKGDPGDPENILRLIMKSGMNPALEIDRETDPMDRGMTNQIFEQRSGIPTNPELNLQNIKTGEGAVKVPAGTFNVELHRIVDPTGKVYAEYTFSQEVAPFGIVSSEAENTTVLLVDQGSGARSLVTEEQIISQQPSITDKMPRGMVPGTSPPQDGGSGPGRNIRQLPGMGTGYEPRQ